MGRYGWGIGAAFLIVALLVVILGSRKPPPRSGGPPAETLKSIMKTVVDPSGSFLFQSVMEVSDSRGITKKAPTTDEDWAEVRHHLNVLHDIPARLSVPGLRAAGPRDRAANPVVENQPKEIQRLLDTQHADFVRRAERLRDAASLGLKAADARDKDALFTALTEIDHACEACHVRYWYPKDERAVRAAREAGLID
ncbi:MAG: hypothetical protein ABIO39_04875 [Caulobacteraceae bacterium]